MALGAVMPVAVAATGVGGSAPVPAGFPEMLGGGLTSPPDLSVVGPAAAVSPTLRALPDQAPATGDAEPGDEAGDADAEPGLDDVLTMPILGTPVAAPPIVPAAISPAAVATIQRAAPTLPSGGSRPAGSIAMAAGGSAPPAPTVPPVPRDTLAGSAKARTAPAPAPFAADRAEAGSSAAPAAPNGSAAGRAGTGAPPPSPAVDPAIAGVWPGEASSMGRAGAEPVDPVTREMLHPVPISVGDAPATTIPLDMSLDATAAPSDRPTPTVVQASANDAVTVPFPPVTDAEARRTVIPPTLVAQPATVAPDNAAISVAPFAPSSVGGRASSATGQAGIIADAAVPPVTGGDASAATSAPPIPRDTAIASGGVAAPSRYPLATADAVGKAGAPVGPRQAGRAPSAEPVAADPVRPALATPATPPVAPMDPAAPAGAAASPDATVPAGPSIADTAITHRLTIARDGQWLDQLARDIARTAAHDGALRFRLNPEHLGSLAVEVRQTADGAALRLSADTEAARAIIADAQPRLVAEARAQGVRIAETQVDLGGGRADGQARQQPHPSPEPARPITQRSENRPAVTVNTPIAAKAERYA